MNRKECKQDLSLSVHIDEAKSNSDITVHNSSDKIYGLENNNAAAAAPQKEVDFQRETDFECCRND